MLSVDQFLTREDRDAIRAPIERARTFPQLAYYDPGFFALEVERIFSRNWIAVGFGSSLPAPGDRAPVEFCFMPGCPLSAKCGRDDHHSGNPARRRQSRKCSRLSTFLYGKCSGVAHAVTVARGSSSSARLIALPAPAEWPRAAWLAAK